MPPAAVTAYVVVRAALAAAVWCRGSVALRGGSLLFLLHSAAGVAWVVSQSPAACLVWLSLYGVLVHGAATPLLPPAYRAALAGLGPALAAAALLPPLAAAAAAALLPLAAAPFFVAFLRPQRAPGQPLTTSGVTWWPSFWVLWPHPALAACAEALLHVWWWWPPARLRWTRALPPDAALAPDVYENRVLYCLFTGFAYANAEDDRIRTRVRELWALDRDHAGRAPHALHAWRPAVTYWGLRDKCRVRAFAHARDLVRTLGDQSQLVQRRALDVPGLSPPERWGRLLENLVADIWPAFVQFLEPDAPQPAAP